MIEWIFHFPESKRLLERMVKEITATIKRKCHEGMVTSHSGKLKLEYSSVIRIGVLCQDGAQLSPCFVERLYDYFSCRDVAVEGLRVQRQHLDAMKGVWRHSKDIVWQVSCIPVHKKMFFHSDHILESGNWTNFDAAANTIAEEHFKQNPFKTGIDFADMVLDFESGTAYRKQTRKKYYIHCTDIKHSGLHCWFLTKCGYKTASRMYKGAGIQPYSVHPATGEAVFLLGQITYGSCDWCDFGGLKGR